MQAAEYYLKELLYEYDCVTIPGLGGFIMQTKPATINRGKNRVYPPSRYPSFNSLLNHDDGLLISCISKRGKLSYREAGSVVNEFAENCKKKIVAGEPVILEGIGELTSGPENVTRFRPSNQANFFPGAYGMEPVSLYPIDRQQNPPRIAKKPVDRTARQVKEKKPASVAWTLALSLPVIMFLLYGIIFPSSLQNIYANYSGIVYELIHTTDTRPKAAELSPKTIAVPEVKINPVAGISTPEVKIVPETETKTESVSEPVVQLSPKYYVIGGCFENEANAGKFLAELISRGFEAEQAGKTKSGHTRISYKSFPDRTSALSYLQMIRNEENATAWLLKY
jgi:hypothetical protein